MASFDEDAIAIPLGGNKVNDDDFVLIGRQ